MAEIIKEPWIEEIVEYEHEFYRNGRNFDDGGYGFSCTKDGEVIGADEYKDNFAKVMANVTHNGCHYAGIIKYVRSIKHGISVRCNCGSEFELPRGYDSMCEHCGQWYNPYGQELRDDWMLNISVLDEDVDDMTGYEESIPRF